MNDDIFIVLHIPGYFIKEIIGVVIICFNFYTIKAKGDIILQVLEGVKLKVG